MRRRWMKARQRHQRAWGCGKGGSPTARGRSGVPARGGLGFQRKWSGSGLDIMLVSESITKRRTCDVLADRMLTTPTHASHEMRPRVWMLPRPKPTMAATATNTAVQVPCVERAFKPVEIPRIPEPATKIQSSRGLVVEVERVAGRLTKSKDDTEELVSNTSKQLPADIVDTVHV
jgi:hypothetical protein